MTYSLALGPRIRKSPFFDSTVNAGVTHFTTYNHMYMPVSYGDLEAEYKRLVSGVAMWDVAGQRQVSLKGADAVELARLLTPRNLDGLSADRGLYVPLCDSRGTLINDPVLQKVGSDEVWLSIADSDMKYWAEAFATSRGMDVVVSEPDASPLAVQGPNSAEVMRGIFGDWVVDLKHFGFRWAEVEGIPVLVARSGWSKQGGYELYLCDASRGVRLWDIVAEAGAAYGIGPGAPNYIERVESGLISVGADTDALSNPYEMGLGKFVDLAQDVDFIGKAALKRIYASGIKRRFCGLLIDGAAFTATNAHRVAVHQGGVYVGFASALAYSPRLEKNIATALLTVEAAIGDETPLEVLCADGRRTARATPLPFKISEGQIKRG